MRVYLEYFKSNGNYVASGEYESSCNRMKTITEEVRSKLYKRSLPGLIRPHTALIIRIAAEEIDYPSVLGSY